MIIDASCVERINSKEAYIHDDILEELCFKRVEKELVLTILKQDRVENKRYKIKFLHVIGFEATSCDFWGASPYILDFEYMEENEKTIIPKMFEKESADYPFCTLNNREKYIEIIITFISGDKLKIACESIII